MEKVRNRRAFAMGSGAPDAASRAASAPLLGSVSAAALLAGMSFMLAPSPALAACSDNSPANGETVTCDAGTDTIGVDGGASTDVTVMVTPSGAINTDGLSVLLNDRAAVNIAGSVTTADGPAILLGDDGFVDVSGSVTNTGAGGVVMTLGENAEVVVRGTGTVESQGAGIQLQHGSLDVEAGGRIVASRSFAVEVNSATAADPFVANIAGTVEGLGEAPAFLLSDYSTLNLHEGGVIRTVSTGGIQRHAIHVTGNSVLNLNGTVETSGANQSHGVLISGRDTAVTIGPDGRIITHEDLSSGIMSVVGDATIVVESGGEITAEGDNAFGIRAQGGGNSITVEAGGSIVTKGTGSSADAIRVDQSSSGSSLVRVDGTVEAQGANVYAIRAASAHVIVSGTVSSDNTAIQFFHNAYGSETNTNRLELQPGFTINGSARGTDHPDVEDILVFGGDTGSASFDVASIGASHTSGAQFSEFEAYEKIGNSTWTLTGVNAEAMAFDVLGGTLLADAAMGGADFTVANGAVLGGTGTLGDVTVGFGGMIDAGDYQVPGTLTVSSLALDENAMLRFDLGTPDQVGGDSDLIVVEGDLTLDGTLAAMPAPAFGNGLYTLIQYGNLAADNGLEPVGETVPEGYTFDIAAGPVNSGAGAVTLLASSAAAGGNQFWDGAGPAGNGAVEGGTGVWNSANANWTNQAGDANAAWAGEFAIFGGTAGTVTVEGAQAFTGMQFLTGGYTIAAGTGGVLDAADTGATIRVGAGATATLDVQVTGGPVTKVEGGTLVLTADEIVDPSALVETWTVEGGELIIDGRFVAGDWDVAEDLNNNDALILRNGSKLRVTQLGVIDRNSGPVPIIRIDGQGHVLVDGGGFVDGQILGAASNSTVQIAGELKPSGGSIGYYVTRLEGDGNTVEVTPTGVVETIGRTRGIVLIGDTNSVTVNGHLETGVQVAISLEGNAGEIQVGGTVRTTGDSIDPSGNPRAIQAYGDDNVVTIDATGQVSTLGIYATGIHTQGDNNRISVAGIVSTEADIDPEDENQRPDPNAIYMTGNGNILEISGTAATAGSGMPTVVLDGNSSTMRLSGAVSAADASETAIRFKGGSISSQTTLELRPGYSITGLVVGDADAFQNNLVFGGDSGSGTFDVSAIGDTAQFRNFGPAKGAFYKSGNSTWTLTGTNDAYHPSVFRLQGGTLLVNGSMAGTGFSNLDNVATLGGTGTVGYIEMLAGGTVAPGNSIGTLNVAGNVSFGAGSTFEVEIAGDGTSDRLAVGGTATLSGGTVSVIALDPQTSYQNGQSYTILTADGGVSGAFDEAVAQSIFITPTLDYSDPDAVMLKIALDGGAGPVDPTDPTDPVDPTDPTDPVDPTDPGNPVDPTDPTEPGLFANVAQTYNQLQAATALDGLDQTAGSDANAAFVAIINGSTSEAEARAIFDQTSGEVHATSRHVIGQSSTLFNRTLRYQGVAGAAGNRAGGVWVAPLGAFGQVDGDGNAARLEWWSAGFAGGYEGALGDHARGGIGFGYIRSHGAIDGRLSALDSDGFHIGAYGAWADGPWAVAGSLSYGAHHISAERGIAFMGRTARTDYWIHGVDLSAEASYGFDLSGSARIAPLLTLDAGRAGHGGFAETGAGALDLTAGSESWTRADTGLGLMLTSGGAAGGARLEGRALWEHALADVVPAQALSLAGSPTGFTVHGPAVGRDRLRLGAGIAWNASGGVNIRLRYDGLFAGDQSSHSASLGLHIGF